MKICNTDKKTPHSAGGINIDYYTADISSVIDYYPFGQLMPGRNYNADMFCFGFNGMMKDDEITEQTGSIYTALYWEYDSRTGRRWNVDPITIESESPYACFSNNPILYADPNGDFRTKFGAWMYSVFHGGEVTQDKGGEWFVGRQVEDKSEEGGATYERKFDWNGRNSTKGLEWLLDFDKKLEAWKERYETEKFLEEQGIEYYYTDDVWEARCSWLQLSTIGLLPNPILKVGTAMANSSKAINTVKVSSRIKASSLQEFKTLVNQLSKPGSKLSQQELNE